MDIVTIEKLTVDSDAKIGEGRKKALIAIMEEEFRTQRTLYNAKAEAMREEVLEQYKKGVGYAALKKAYEMTRDAKDKILDKQGKLADEADEMRKVKDKRQQEETDAFHKKCQDEDEKLREKIKALSKKTDSELFAADKAIRDARRKINLKGLTDCGERYEDHIDRKDIVMLKARAKIIELFEAVEDMAPQRIRNKVIARMWLAETNGEACVILQQVLGNGIIPTMTQKLLANKG